MRTANRFKVGDRVKVQGAIKSACYNAIILENRGDCGSDEAPCYKGYYVRFANGTFGGGWYDHDFEKSGKSR